MRDWFEGLEVREKRILIAGAIFLTVFILYWFIIGPIVTGTTGSRERITEKQQAFTRMQAMAAQIQARATPPGGILVGASPQIIVQRVAEKYDLADSIKTSRPVDQTSVSVRFEAASFDNLVLCLGELQATHGLNIRSASFTAGTQAGLVRAQLVLARAGS